MNKKVISIVSCSILFLLPLLSFAKMATVKGNKVNLRKGPGTKYEIKWEYGDGLPVEILDYQKNWIKIKDFEGDTGWIHKSLLHEQPHVIVTANRNTDQKINIRRNPSTKSEIIGEAFYGVVFESLEKHAGWVKVRHETGLTGWINENLLWGY